MIEQFHGLCSAIVPAWEGLQTMLTDCETFQPLAGLYSSRTRGSVPLLDEASSCALLNQGVLQAMSCTWVESLVMICFWKRSLDDFCGLSRPPGVPCTRVGLEAVLCSQVGSLSGLTACRLCSATKQGLGLGSASGWGYSLGAKAGWYCRLCSSLV